MIIRHKKFMDICFQYWYSYGNSYAGKWINMGYVNSWYLPAKTEFITVEDKSQWEQCLDPTAKCLRYAKWAPL